MQFDPKQPIGIFDSGVGGLTVAGAIKQLMPNEKLVYFGDTAHLPYGDKSAQTVQYYSKRISGFLLKQGCKIILIACNTASAVAYKTTREFIGEKAMVFNVIDPVVNEVGKLPNANKIGVIGTKGTINSGTYEKKIIEKGTGKEVLSLATPLFVPMIEEGFIFDDISNAIIRTYLSNEKIKGIDTIILGCTHYPIIRNQIAKFYDFGVNVIDSARIVAREIRDSLRQNNLLNPNLDVPGNEFHVSDYTEYFEKISRMFFEEEIKLTKSDIWNTG
jgi:glutamate racemase